MKNAHLLSRRALLIGLTATASVPAFAQKPVSKAAALIEAARAQVGVTLTYDPAYTQLAYPNGDVDRARGVCTDVIVRAYRDAFGVDLQQIIHADMAKNFAAYPKRWGLAAPDRNIDHRRVLNLETYFKRNGAALPLSTDPKSWQPGDIFTSLVGGDLLGLAKGSRPHIGIVSDKIAPSGNPLVLHNIGAGAREEDALFAHKLVGRYRWLVEG